MNENVIYYIKEERTRGGYNMLDVLFISFTITTVIMIHVNDKGFCLFSFFSFPEMKTVKRNDKYLIPYTSHSAVYTYLHLRLYKCPSSILNSSTYYIARAGPAPKSKFLSVYCKSNIAL